MTASDAWIICNHLFYLSAGKGKLILEQFDNSPEKFLSSGEVLLRNHCGDKIFERYKKINWEKWISDVHLLMQEHGIHSLSLESDDYPSLLKEIYDPPLVLFCKGTPLKKDTEGIGLVGTRYPTEYGKMLAYNYALNFSSQGFKVISGMARGLDSEAHKGAIKSKAGTIAVLGCGLDYIYPKENTLLSRDILQNGTLISEYTPGVKPIPVHFPFRNRIISGLSRGILVVEAAEKSGSLITAHSALDQNRLVWAIPGRPKDKLSLGCNQLIQMGAKMVLDPKDVLSDMGISETLALPPPSALPTTKEENLILAELDDEPVHIDVLCDKLTPLSPQALSLSLLNLEMRKAVKRLPGDFLVKVL